MLFHKTSVIIDEIMKNHEKYFEFDGKLNSPYLRSDVIQSRIQLINSVSDINLDAIITLVNLFKLFNNGSAVVVATEFSKFISGGIEIFNLWFLIVNASKMKLSFHKNSFSPG
jgi:hypothetical protein